MVKTKFKQTEIGLIPEDWEIGRFEDYMTGFSSGMTPYRANKHFYKGEIPWITSGELNYNVIQNTIEHITEDAVIKTNLKLIPKGTFLMAITGLEAEGTRGSCAITGINATTNQSCMALYPNEQKLKTSYLYHYYVKYGKELALKYCQGTKQQSYNAVTAKKLPIFFPKEISEQQAIAKALSDTDVWIESLEKMINKKQLIKQGTMQELLMPKEDWEEVILGKVAQINMGQSPLSQYYNKRGMGLPLIQGNSDIQNRRTIIRNFTSSITKKGDLGDIIMSVRAPVGEIAIATFNCCLGRGVCSMKYPNRFLYHYLIFREQSWGQVTTGSTFDSVNSTQIENFKIHLPSSLSEQNRIATILSDMDAEIETLENKLYKAKQLRQGMMQDLLTGRIRLVESVEKSRREIIHTRGHNDHFNDAVLIGTMASVFGSDKFPLTRFKYTKVSYLLKRYKEEQDAGYLKHAAGPYKPKTRYGGAEKIAINKKYIDVVATNYKGKEYEGFVASENVDEAIKYFEDWYGADALKWIEQFKFEKNDNLELWATVDMAIEDLKKKDETITVSTIKQVLKENKEWEDKLKRSIFSDINIQKAIIKLETLFT